MCLMQKRAEDSEDNIFRLLLEGLVPGCSAMPAAGFWRFVLPVRRLHSNTGLP